ncbi:MAG: hypothetical protein RR059_05385 [Clostridia bacterium]
MTDVPCGTNAGGRMTDVPCGTNAGVADDGCSMWNKRGGGVADDGCSMWNKWRQDDY